MGTFVRVLVVVGMVAAGWGLAGADTLTPTPASRNFGNVSVSAGASAPLTIDLENDNSNTEVTGFTTMATMGSCADFFISYGAVPALLLNNDHLTVTITYNPSDRVADVCVVTTTFGNPTGDGGVFTLSGDGIAPVLAVSPGALDFASQRWNGGAGQTLSITLTNTGDEPITSTNISAAFQTTTASYSFGAFTGLPIAGGGMGTLPVIFNPSSVGQKDNIVIIALNNDAALPGDGIVEVHGLGTQSIQTFAPTSLNVGSYDVNAGNGTANIAIGNDATATATLTITNARIVGTNATDFSFTDHGCTGQGPCMPTVMNPPIEAGTTETFAIRCTPTGVGTRAATLEITSDDPNGGTGNPGMPRTAALTCNGRTPEVTVNPLTLPFGVVRVGASSQQSFTISNGTGVNQSNLTYAVTESVTDVTIACNPTCSGTLTPGTQATVTVNFAPTAVGLRTGNIVVTTNDLDESTVNVPMSGSGFESNLSASTPPPFGNVPVAQVGGTLQNATITNNGGASLNTQMMTISGDASFSFAFPNGACTSGTTCNEPARVVTAAANGGTAVIPIRCDPTSAGLKTATLNIISDDPAPAGGTNIALTCTGTVSAMAVSPPMLGFGNQRINNTSATMDLVISNVGGAAALNYSVTEPAGDQFIVTAGSVCNPTCNNLTVPAGGMTTITVAFRPTTVGLKTGTVLINDLDNFVTDVNVSVSGTGVEPTATLTTPATLAFGNVRINTTSNQLAITVVNNGTMDLTVTGVTHTEGQAGQDNFDVAGPGPLGMSTIPSGGGTQTWNVTCDPEVRGDKTGSVTIANNSLNAPSIVVALTCTSQEGMVVVTSSLLSGTTIDFGFVRLNTSVMNTVTLSNPGNVDVTINSITLASMTQGFSTTPPSSMTLLANNVMPRTFNVVFAPTLDAHGTTSMTIDSQDWNDPVITLVGDGEPTGFACTLDAPVLTDVQWDGTQVQGVTLRNTGTANANVLGVAWLSGDIGEFANIVAGTGQGNLGTGQARGFNITAVPTDAMLGVRSAVLRVTTDMPMNMGQFCDIPVTYTSVGPAVTLTPGMVVDFGGVDVDAGPMTIPLQITNSGTGRMDITNVGALTGSFSRASFIDQSLEPAQAESIMITYDPSVEGSETMRETQNFTITTDGLFMGSGPQPPAIQITVTGFGIDRHIAAADVIFPPTYRYPTDAQVATDTCGAAGDEPCAIRICNTGAARLDIMMIEDTDDAFDLASTSPQMVPGGSLAAPTCVEVDVTFRPTGEGTFSSTVTLVNNDNGAPMADVMLTGTGIAREVDVPADVIDLGRLPLEDHDLSELDVRLNNRSGDATFMIRELRPVGSAPKFELQVGSGVQLPPGEHAIDGTLHLTTPGLHNQQFEVLLDDDPEPYGTLSVTVEAAEKENYYSCSSGRPVELGGGLLAALAAIAMRRRRYSRPCRPSDGTTMNGS